MQWKTWKALHLFSFALMFVFAAALVSWGQELPAGVAAERAKFIDKLKEINRWGPDHRIVTDVSAPLDKAIAANNDLIVLMGPGLTKESKAYRLTWKNSKFNCATLTPEEITKEGVKDMTMSVTREKVTETKPAKPPAS